MILVTGASGTLGKAFCKQLEQAQIPYIAAGRTSPLPPKGGTVSPLNPPLGDIGGYEWRKLDLATGEGIKEAVKGVTCIVNLASDTKNWRKATDVDGTKKLLETAKQYADVQHFIHISIVGIHQINWGYYRNKLAAEKILEQSGVPYTILRATQFHDFLDAQLHRFLWLPLGALPKRILLQPIEVQCVAEKLLDIYKQNQPTREIQNIGGVEVLQLGDIVQKWASAQRKTRWILPLPFFGKLGNVLNAGALTCPEHVAEHSCTWTTWLQQKYGNA